MTPKPSIFKAKTAFATLAIERNGDHIYLRTDDNALQSVVNLKNPERLELQNLRSLMGILLFLPVPEKVCLLGTGGGGLVHFFRHHYPNSHITAIEIDDELLGIMHERMNLPQADEGLTYIVDDARHFIETNQKKYDLIIADLFLGNQSPDWLLKKTSMQALDSMLTNAGGLCYNLVIDSEQDFNTFYASLRQVFDQQTLCLPVAGLDNTIAYALRQHPADCEMPEYMQRALDLGERHDINYLQTLSAIYATNPSGSGII